MKKTMNRMFGLIAAIVLLATTARAQNESDPIATGLGGVATVVGETQTPADSVSVEVPVPEVPLWKKKLYYGYNFDIYFHHDSKEKTKENGWSIAVEPEIGWKLKERIYLGMRVGGAYEDTYTTYSYEGLLGETYTEDVRVMHGSWSVTPYMRYRLKTLFNDKLGIWLEAHLYTGMEFPRVMSGNIQPGTDYDGLRYSLTYGAQVSPVITYRFNRKSTFQIFFSILSFGYSGTTRFYEREDEWTGEMVRHNEYRNDVIIFSGKLKNMLSNQFTPGLYGLKFGVQKNF